MSTKKERLLSVGEAAERLGVTVDVVRSLADNGELPPARTGGGHRRFESADVEALKARWTSRGKKSRSPSRAALPVRRVSQPRARAPRFDPDVWDISDDPYEQQQAREAEENRVAAERKAQDEAAAAEQRRLDEFRNHAESRLLSVLGVPQAVRAQALVDMRQWITSTRIPKGLSEWAARELVENQIKVFLKPHYDAVEREQKKQEDARKVEELIRKGNHHAWMETFKWESDEREPARREVERELRRQVDATWDVDEVTGLVEGLLYDDPEQEGEEGEEDGD
jgi:excisionase family DNA binding protein